MQNALDFEFKEKFGVVRTTMVAGDYPFTNLPITYRFGASTAIELLVSFFGRKGVQSIPSVAEQVSALGRLGDKDVQMVIGKNGTNGMQTRSTIFTHSG
jgi:hypothetical protein